MTNVNQDRVIQRPLTPDKLILLFHGVGSHADNLLAVGEMIGRQFPQYGIVTVCATEDFDQGPGGKQWFSIAGVDEDSRVQRVVEALPEFVLRIRTYQRMFGLTPQRTVLIGFSQGAIMSLHSMFYEANVASQVISLSGRMAGLPRLPLPLPHNTRFDFIHGALDGVIFPAYATAAANHLKGMGYVTTMALVPGMGHEINQDVMRLLISVLPG